MTRDASELGRVRSARHLERIPHAMPYNDEAAAEWRRLAHPENSWLGMML